MKEIYIPKHNDFNSPERLSDEKRYFSENKGKTYDDYQNQFPDMRNISLNKIVEYSSGKLGYFEVIN
jgi:hypothetical protein